LDLIEDQEYDSDDLRHNCHSDVDIYADEDPMFEYNKCHKHSFLDKRLEDRLHTYDQMRVSTFVKPSS